MDFEQAKKEMQKLVTSERYEHCLGVMDFAGELAEIYGIDAEKAFVIRYISSYVQFPSLAYT